jgi:hypothetical protein
MSKAIKIDVTFPSGETRTFRSIRAVARMLSGTGQTSGGFRRTVSRRASWSGIVRNNHVVDHDSYFELKIAA